MEKLEILAPVGNREMLEVAINSGADAVYLGGSMFNARMKADNFDNQSLKDCVRYAHLNGTKVYLTLNTLITDEEVPKLIEQVKIAVDSKVDAFIVQDLGVAYLLKKHFKNIVLHASTQMGVHNYEGAQVLEKMGFSRVVLARETTLEDIKLIKQNTSLEIEYFIHGALCVAFSGNCYLSSEIKNKSGNRGECLQLCRLFYNCTSCGKEVSKGYLLSTKDLCYGEKLKELVEAGVTSFKIEGRLKRPAYVGTTVQIYKNAIKNFNFDKNHEKNLKKVFSRGDFNCGIYLNDGNANIINKDIQNHLGEKIGKVIKVEKFKDLHKITIKSSHKIIAGDGLKFISKDGFVNSLGVGNVENKNGNYVVYSKSYPSENDDVFLMVDHAFEEKILQVKKKLNISAKFIAKQNEQAKLVLRYKDIEVEEFSEKTCEKAVSSAITKDNIIKNLSKTKETCFNIEDFDIELQENLFLPLVEINNMRRNSVEKLEEEIIKRNSPISVIYKEEDINEEIESIKNIQINNDNKAVIMVKNEKELEKYDTNNISKIIINTDNYSQQNIENISQLIKNKHKNAKIYLNLPIITNKRDVELIKNILKNNKNLGVVVNNLYGILIADNRKIIIGQGLNVANMFSFKQLEKLCSPELVYKSNEKFVKKSCEKLPVYPFEFPLMTFKHCPYKLNYDCNCNNCKYDGKLEYKSANNCYEIKRKKIFNCYFEMLKKVK